jgi:uncharacterized protein (TIGR02118 family)
MHKLISIVHFRKDLAAEEARRMYEEEHAPLVLRLMPMIHDYRRNYVSRPAGGASSPAPVEFDVLTELWFKGAEELAAFRSELRGEKGERMREDSRRFLAGERTVTFGVEEVASTRESATAGEVGGRSA